MSEKGKWLANLSPSTEWFEDEAFALQVNGYDIVTVSIDETTGRASVTVFDRDSSGFPFEKAHTEIDLHSITSEEETS